MILRITDLARGGAGVARDETGRVIFVPFTAPGDLIRAKVVKTDPRYAWADIVEILEPSQQRQVAPCPVFGQCGGCQWQHLPYSLQWETKVKGLQQALGRAKLSLPAAFDQIPAEQVWGYRNRIQLRGEQGQLGFYKENSHELVPAPRCEIARPEINAAWEQTRIEGAQLGQSFKVEVEVAADGNVTRVWNAPHSASGFRQVHDEQNEKMKAWIGNSLQKAPVLYDLFGGSGNLCLPLVGKFQEIHCVDTSAPSVHPQNVPSQIRFHQSSVAAWALKEAKRQKSSRSASAILDPPREGLGKQFDPIATSLEALGVQELVAVGCDVDSWVRDVSKWVKRGWTLKRVMAIDLFPQTSHIEAIALLGL